MSEKHLLHAPEDDLVVHLVGSNRNQLHVALIVSCSVMDRQSLDGDFSARILVTHKRVKVLQEGVLLLHLLI